MLNNCAYLPNNGTGDLVSISCVTEEVTNNCVSEEVVNPRLTSKPINRNNYESGNQ